MPMPSVIRRSGTTELDAEKAPNDAVELEGERREELDDEGRSVRFELEGGSGIKKEVQVVMSKQAVQSAIRSAMMPQQPQPTSGESSGGNNAPVRSVSRTVSVKREPPPLPTKQGKPGCPNEKEKTLECGTMRETRERERWRSHYSVGPDGSYNYT